MKIKCPFINNNKWCDYKKPFHKKRLRCLFKHPEKCPYYNSSKTKLKVDSEGLKTPEKDIVD